MAIAGIGFTKITVEKKKMIKEKISIKNNVVIQELSKDLIPLGKNEAPALKLTFEYRSDYEPDIGSIVLIGDVLDIKDEAEIDTIVENWKKDKKVDNKVLEPVIERKVNAEFFIMEMYETCTDDDCVAKMEKFLTSIGMLQEEEK